MPSCSAPAACRRSAIRTIPRSLLQIDLRFHFDLDAGVRPVRLIPVVPSPVLAADQRDIDFVLIRESTEGLFASRGKGG